MATKTLADLKYPTLTLQQLAMFEIIGRERKKMEEITGEKVQAGEVGFTGAIDGVVLQGKGGNFTHTTVDWEKLVRTLLWAMTKEQKDQAEERLSDPKSRELETDLEKWTDLVSTSKDLPRAGQLTGQFSVNDFMSDNPTDIAREV
jgi:hypothetical protein